MGALLANTRQADFHDGENPEERLLVPGNQGFNTFRGCPGGRVVDLFRAREFIPNLLKTRGEILSANRGPKTRAIAEQHRFEFMHHQVWDETTLFEIGTHLFANIRRQCVLNQWRFVGESPC